MFLLKKQWNILFMLYLILGITPKIAFSQCPSVSPIFIEAPKGFTTNETSIEVNKTLIVTADPTLSATVKNSIKYRVGYFGSATLAVNDFKCNTTPCKTNANINIPTETDFEVIQSPDLNISFSKPGIYYIIQFYTNGSGYARCERIIVFPKPVFTYKTCNCVTVIVNIPKVPENEFYDEVEVIFSNDATPLKIAKADYGKKYVLNAIRYANYSGSGPCPNRGNFKAIGIKTQQSPFTPFKEGSEQPLIDFVTTNVTANGIVHWAEELKHEANGDFTFKSKEPVDIIEISNDDGLSWSDLPVSNFTISKAGREFTISNVPLPPGGTLCFRGNAKNPCGNTIPANMRPKACMTGVIQNVFAELSATSGNRDIIVQLESKDTNPNSSVRVLRTSASKPEKILTQNALIDVEYMDSDPECDGLKYRTETILSEIDPGTTINKITKIITQTVDYKLDGSNFQKLTGNSTVTVKNNGYGNNEQISNISNAFLAGLTGTKKINYYSEINNNGVFTKLTPTPLNQSFLLDNTSLPNQNTYCYAITLQDQCGYETPLSSPICTILLKSNTLNTVNWNNANIATDISGNYLTNDSYILQEVACSSGSCVDISSFPSTTENFYNMDKADIDTLKHSIYVRISVNTSPAQTNNVSNIFRYFFPPKLYIPTVFTPNGLSVNETFHVRGTHVNQFKFDIYDRWGTKVKSFENISDKWDGKDFPEGTYYYQAEATDFSNDPSRVLKKSGNFLLVR